MQTTLVGKLNDIVIEFDRLDLKSTQQKTLEQTLWEWLGGKDIWWLMYVAYPYHVQLCKISKTQGSAWRWTHKTLAYCTGFL